MPKLKHEIDSDNRHQLFLDILGELGEWNIASIADAAEVAPATLYFWLNGVVSNPSTRTLFAVAEAMGYKLEWKKAGGKPRLTLVK